MKKLKEKMNKNYVPKDFTLSLALFDAIPVIAFGISLIIFSRLFNSALVLIGALLVFIAGLCKVIWKIIVVLKQKNIWGLIIQMRIMMPIGFVLMIVGIIASKDNVNFGRLCSLASSYPINLFLIIFVIGMILMMVFAFLLDGRKLKINWIEQITNAIAQISLLIAALLLKKYM